MQRSGYPVQGIAAVVSGVPSTGIRQTNRPPGTFGAVPQHGTAIEERSRVKHTQAITRKPQVAAISNFQAFKQFLVNLTDQAVEFVFQKTS